MAFEDRYRFVMAPVDPWHIPSLELLQHMGKVLCTGQELCLEEFINLPTWPLDNPEQLKKLESDHRLICLYMWFR